ncbi:MAG: hypothetical protein P8123_10325, partial [bacterium]
GILYWLFRSLSISVWSIIGGTLIDLDHLYDYARYPHRPGKRVFDVGHFFEVLTTKKLINVYVLLHSWELIALVLVLGWFFPSVGGVLIPLGFGMAVHILLDACTNPTSIICYSIIGRYAHRFDGTFFFRK